MQFPEGCAAMKIQRCRMLVIFFLLSFVLCGCSAKNAPHQAVEYYALNYTPLPTEARPMLPVALSIENFRSSPPFHTQRIIYSLDDVSQNRYFYHAWMNPPDEMIPPLLARDFRAANYFRAVLSSGELATSVQVFGVIDQFYEKDTDDQWFAVLSMTMTLVDRQISDSTNQIRFQKSYEKTTPMAYKNPKSLARAMSQGLAEISAAVIQDIYAVLAADGLK